MLWSTCQIQCYSGSTCRSTSLLQYKSIDCSLRLSRNHLVSLPIIHQQFNPIENPSPTAYPTPLQYSTKLTLWQYKSFCAFSFKLPSIATVPHHRTNPPPSQSPSRSRESTIIIHIISYKALVCSKPSCSKAFFSSGNSHGLPKHSHKCHRIEYLCRSPTILHV